MTSAPLAAQRESGDVAAFVETLGENQLLSGEAAGRLLGSFPATAVVEPESTEEVQAVMAAAARTGVNVLPAGSGSWLPAGGWASGADVVLSTRRLDEVTHYEPADLTATVGAGLAWTALQSLLDEKGQWLPLDPPGVMKGTVGGVVAAGVSGSLRGHFGATRDTVLGLEVVTGDGRRLEVGGRVVKNVAGYDLVRLLTGSRGSLGVITRVSVRLFPKSAADVTAVFTGSMEDAVEMARGAATAPVPVASIELQGGAEWSVAVRLLGGTNEVRDSMERVVAAMGRGPTSTLEGEAS
ncbi:MAG: FAD-binding oxidoreductase, partial [Longimicrobiales bacterium]